MKETILLFGFSKERQQKVIRALLPLKLRIKRVETAELGLPLSVVAGFVEPASEAIPKQETEPVSERMSEPTREQMSEQETEPTRELGDEMLVMAGLTSARIDAVLMGLRKSKAGPIPYKAVLTESNQKWNAYELLEELKKEHARFTAETP